MRDVARILAEARATKFQPPAGMPTLTPVAPTATIGNVQPGTRPANTGFKRFMVGPGGDYGDLANPVFVGKQMANAANEQIVRPLREGADAFNPFLTQTPIERANKAAAGLLVAADLATPFMPEGSILRGAAQEVGDIGLNAGPARPVISPKGYEFPRNAATVRWESSMRDLARRYAGQEAVPSFQVQGSVLPKILASGRYEPGLDPESGYLGLARQLSNQAGDASHNAYALSRAEIEQIVGGPAYGHIRNPMDMATASSYRHPRSFLGVDTGLDPQAINDYWTDHAAQSIIDFTPPEGATVVPGDSYMMFRRFQDKGMGPGFRDIVQPYDPSLPAIVEGAPTPETYKQLFSNLSPETQAEFGVDKLKYAEIQSPPVDVADMQRALIIRDKSFSTPTYVGETRLSTGELVRKPNAMQVLARNRQLAEQARNAGLDVVTGETRYGTSMLPERDAAKLRSNPNFMDMLREQFFVPDRVSLDQVPADAFRERMKKMSQVFAQQRREALARKMAEMEPRSEFGNFLARPEPIA